MSKTFRAVLALALWGFAGLMTVMFLMPAEADICDDTAAAYAVSQSIISERFPDPGATRFLAPSDPRVTVEPSGDCGFFIAARVDYPASVAGAFDGFGYSMDMTVTDRERKRFAEANVTLDRRTQPATTH